MNKLIKGTLGLLGLSLILLSCTTAQEEVLPEGAVRVGNQIWMDHNLNEKTFRNGDAIELCQDPECWIEAFRNKKPAMLYYNFDETANAQYGALYNVWALLDERGLAPDGWRVPLKEDVDSLFKDQSIPYFLRSKGSVHDGSGLWKQVSYTFTAQQDTFGFNAQPVGEVPGYVEALNEVDFNAWGERVSWWTASPLENHPDVLRFWTLYQGRHGNFHGQMAGARIDAAAGHYVRCLK